MARLRRPGLRSHFNFITPDLVTDPAPSPEPRTVSPYSQILEARDLKEFVKVGPPPVKMSQDTSRHGPSDKAVYARMMMAWNKGHGEPKRRRAPKKTWKRRAPKYKKKWVPRKQYLARKRKVKYGKKRK